MSEYKRRPKEHDVAGYFKEKRKNNYSRDFNTDIYTDIKAPESEEKRIYRQEQQKLMARENDPEIIQGRALFNYGLEMIQRKEQEKEENKHEYMPWYNNIEDREKLKNDVIAKYEKRSYRNANDEIIEYYTSKIGNATLIMGSGVSKDDLEKTDVKTFEVLRDLVNDNDITEITVSSFYRTPEESGKVKGSSSKSPHTQGRGIDITSVKGRDEDDDIIGALFNVDKLKKINEPVLANKITNWAKNDKRISQVLTPWRIISDDKEEENKYLKNRNLRDKLHYPHRHHMHLTIIIN